MRCSLLTLSGYLDDELDTSHRGEVDAHLVSCQRCRHGLGYLEEEMVRVGGLARVHVPDHGVYVLMQQLGLMGTEDMLPARASPSPQRHTDHMQPWLVAGVSSRAALPWVPRRDSGEAAARDDSQPHLPFADVPLHELPSNERPVASVDDPALEEAEVELSGHALHDPESVLPHDLDGFFASPPPLPTEGFDDLDPVAGVPSPGADVPPTGHPAGPVAQEPSATLGMAPNSWPASAPSSPPTGIGGPEPRPAPISPAPPPRHFTDLDDDPWNWAPRDHEVPTTTTTATAPAMPPPAPPAVARGDVEEETDPRPEAFLVGAAEPPRALPPSPLGRIRDQIALRLSLARGGRRHHVDDGVQIVSGLGAPVRAAAVRRPSRRTRPLSGSTPAPPIESGGPIAAAARSHELEMPAAPARSPVWRRPRNPGDSGPSRPAGSGIGEPRTHPGRHSQALVFRRSPWRAVNLSAPAAAVSGAASTAVERGRQVLAHPRQRWIAVGLVAVLLLVLGLSLRRAAPQTQVAGSHPGAATAASASPTRAASPVAPTAAAPQSQPPVATPPAAAAPPVPAAQTFGAGGHGWQVHGLRYGVHPGDFRIVFDLVAANASASASPTAVVAFSDPQTMLVTFPAALPAGTTGTLPTTNVVAAVTQTQNGQQTVFHFRLAHPVSVSGLYVTAPLRFVIDLH